MIDVENLSVLLTQIVRQHLRVEMKNVLILVIAHRTLIVRLEITEVYANVGQVLLVTRMESLAHLVRSFYFSLKNQITNVVFLSSILFG